MTSMKRKYRTIYLVTAALMVAMVGGYALAATTTTGLPAQGSNITGGQPGGFGTIGSVSSEQLVVLTASMTGAQVAGTQIGTVAMVGTPYAISKCAATPCTPQYFRPVTPVTPGLGDYGEQIVLSIAQPTGGSQGFDFSISITINGAATPLPAFQGYLATNTTAVAGGVTVPVYLFVDLGTMVAPVVNSVSMVFNTCSLPTACP